MAIGAHATDTEWFRNKAGKTPETDREKSGHFSRKKRNLLSFQVRFGRHTWQVQLSEGGCETGREQVGYRDFIHM